MDSTPVLKFYGWPMSPYSAKARAWLRYKQIPFEEHNPTFLQGYLKIQRTVGRWVIPVVKTPAGETLQDTRVILDTLEERFPHRPSQPTEPRQRFISAVFEVFGDEWMVLPALHYRWNVPENNRFAVSEFAAWGLPLLPKPLGRIGAQKVADKMSGYLKRFGVAPEAEEALQRRTEQILGLLDVHFASHSFLLGERPCIGDFSMFGMIRAHLQRDPGAPELFTGREHLCRWIDALQGEVAEGDYLPEDGIPETLIPLVQLVFEEQWPYLVTLMERMDTWRTDNPEANRFPRSLGPVDTVVAGVPVSRVLATFQGWKAQRVVERAAGLDQDWMVSLGAGNLSSLPVHPQTFGNYRLTLQ